MLCAVWLVLSSICVVDCRFCCVDCSVCVVLCVDLRRRLQQLRRARVELRRRHVEVRAARHVRVVRPSWSVIVRVPLKVPSQIGRGVPLKSAAGGGDGLLVVRRVQAAVLLAHQRLPADVHRPADEAALRRRLVLGVPVPVRRHDREVLLARVLHRVVVHALVDAVVLARVHAARPAPGLRASATSRPAPARRAWRTTGRAASC